MIGNMAVKASVFLPEDLLQEIDGAGLNRSTFLEMAARKALVEVQKDRRDAEDLAILNANWEQLNDEAFDVLEYQDIG